MPLSRPVITASGKEVNDVYIARGMGIRIPISCINNSEDIWGPDAKKFMPERWLDEESGLTAKAKEVQGYHHIMSFVDGPRICLGRVFAAAEFKVYS